MADKPNDVILEHQPEGGTPSARVESNDDPSRGMQLFHLVKPLLLAILVDGADLTDLFVPGWIVTVPAAAIFTWFITGSFKMTTIWRVVFSVLAAIYLIWPATEAIPLATILTAAAGLAMQMKKRD